MKGSAWTRETLLELIQRALEARDMETVTAAMKVLAVKSPDDAETILAAITLAQRTGGQS